MTSRINPYERLIRRAGHAKWFAWFGRKILTPLDARAIGHRIAPTTLGTHFPLCYLTTLGAKSQELRTVPLLFIDHDTKYAVAATNFGSSRPPAWSINLDAHAQATLNVGSEAIEVEARRATESEAPGLWGRFDQLWPPFATYRERAGRQVPLYVLQPTQA
jgi:deazaflavin-dependent oxidoreductase (nitroreductase family)